MADRYPRPGRGFVDAAPAASRPLRTCVGCRIKAVQEQLIRLRWDGQAIVAEAAGRRGPGRGAYLCAKMSCWEAARRRRTLSRALRLAPAAIDNDAVGEALAGMITGSPCRTGSEPAAPA
ncbi:MAG: YlxR family protein [Candidatus Dormibacteria bacterium]